MLVVGRVSEAVNAGENSLMNVDEVQCIWRVVWSKGAVVCGNHHRERFLALNHLGPDICIVQPTIRSSDRN